MRRDLVLIALVTLAVGAGGRVCPTIDVRSDAASLEKLRGCTVIMGHLHLVLIDTVADEGVFDAYSFPELVEIVDYLLVYQITHLTTLGRLFPNLRVIRGRKRFLDYALVLFRMPDLQEIGLYSLEYIGRGDVIVDRCPKICYVRTIDWKGMGASKPNFVLKTATGVGCKEQECDKSCHGYCWNSKKCQKRTFDYCKRFNDNGDCVAVCPENKVTNYDTKTCMTREECETILNNTWWVHKGACIGECPIFYERDTSVEGGCRDVGRNFTKHCPGPQEEIKRLDQLEQMKGCTHIDGSLEISVSGTNLEGQLEKYLGDIVSISGYLKIGRTKTLTSLEFFKNLTTIKGEALDNKKYSLFVYENENLRKLWNFDDNFKLTIPNGILAFHDNPLLCLVEIEKFENSTGIRGKSDRHISQNSNGYKSFCYQKDLNITIVEINPTNVTIAWERKATKDEMVIGYTLYYLSASEGNAKLFSTSHSSDACTGDSWEGIFVRENQLQLKELYPYTRYAFYIKTYTTAQQVEQTPINYFITESSEPSEPVDLVAEATSNSSILLTWKPPTSTNGLLTHYRVVKFVEEDPLSLIQQRNYCLFPHIIEVKDEEITTAVAMTNSTKENCTCPQSFTEVITEDMRCTEMKKLESCMKHVYHPQVSSFPSMDLGRSIRKREMVVDNDTVEFKTIPANKTWYTFQDLKHYSIYVFYVQACNTKDVGDAVLCSSPVMVSQRTRKKANADVIRDVNVRTEDKNAFVQWSEPEETNSVLVAYQIEYKRTDSDYSKPKFECITYEQYQNSGRVYKLLKLTPGKYAVHVQAVSLSGPGVFSEWEDFQIAAEATFVLPIVLPTVLLFVVVVVTVVVCVLYRRKKALQDNLLFTSVNPDYAGPVYVEDQWEIDRDDIELIKEIGGGTFGMVYQGVIKSRRYACAVKTISSEASMSDRMEFLNEGSVMKTFSDAHHVVKLLGIVSRGQPPLVIMELMERGDLKSYLRRCREPSQNLPTNELYRMAAEIADGMAYLAAKKFVHRDLAARNCMVAADHTVKIGDFGMARDVYETDYYRKGTAGLLPVRWMAPESLADGVFTSDSDVWSYGVVLWEMATYAEQPYQGLSNEEVFNFVKTGGKLTRPKECSDFFFEVMDSCWKWRPNDRPTFLDVVNMLVGHVGEGFKVAAFCFSRQGTELRLNAGPRVYNPPAILPDEEDFFGHYDASEEEVNLYMRDSDRPTSYLSSSRQRNRSSPYHISPGSPSSTFSFDSS